MSGVVLVLSPYLICGYVTFDAQAWTSVQRDYLVVLVSFNVTPVPLNQRLFELGINCRQHVKMFWFDWERRVIVHCHYDGVQTITSRSNLPFYNVEFGADILNYHDCMKNSRNFIISKNQILYVKNPTRIAVKELAARLEALEKLSWKARVP